MEWSTIWGAFGSESASPKLTVDLNDNIYLVGSTTSPEISGEDPLFTVNRPSIGFNNQQSTDVLYGSYNIPEGFIACFSKFNYPLWSTYIGGRGRDVCTGVSASDAGYLYVCGETYAQSLFPINMWWPNACCNMINFGDKEAFISQYDISSLIEVQEQNNSKLNLKLFPIPTQNQLTIEFETPKIVDVSYKCINVLGLDIYTLEQKTSVGLNSIQISTLDFAPGMYIIQLSSSSFNKSLKFIKQ